MTPRRRPYRMAHRSAYLADPPDSAWVNALWIAASVGFLLFVYGMSGAPLVWPVR